MYTTEKDIRERKQQPANEKKIQTTVILTCIQKTHIKTHMQTKKKNNLQIKKNTHTEKKNNNR